MTEQQLPKFMAALVEHQRAFLALKTEESQWVIRYPDRAIDIWVKAIRHWLSLGCLDLQEKSFSPGGEKPFVVSENFVLNDGTNPNALVRIKNISKEFSERFLNKVESLLAKQVVCSFSPRETVGDPEIVRQLGGNIESFTTLREVFSFLLAQWDGRPGSLAINGKMNIFYVYDNKQILTSVRICWLEDGWDIGAKNIHSEYRWNEGNRIFSRAHLFLKNLEVGRV